LAPGGDGVRVQRLWISKEGTVAKIEVTCPEGHRFWMEDYERKACPKCGRVVIGPKAR
jgi:hypothetical protein